jgi:hypothetical protein
MSYKEGKAEELKFIQDKKHLCKSMIKRMQFKHKGLWIQAFEFRGNLALSSPYPKHFDLVKNYLVEMGIVEPKPVDDESNS